MWVVGAVSVQVPSKNRLHTYLLDSFTFWYITICLRVYHMITQSVVGKIWGWEVPGIKPENLTRRYSRSSTALWRHLLASYLAEYFLLRRGHLGTDTFASQGFAADTLERHSSYSHLPCVTWSYVTRPWELLTGGICPLHHCSSIKAPAFEVFAGSLRALIAYLRNND